eukprot:5840436-Amphidinium_carterae.1
MLQPQQSIKCDREGGWVWQRMRSLRITMRYWAWKRMTQYTCIKTTKSPQSSNLPSKLDARAVQIKQAYKELALKMHPDRHHGTGNEEGAHHAFEYLQKAYAVLSDPKKRQDYDAGLAASTAKEASKGGNGTPGGPSWLRHQIALEQMSKQPSWYSVAIRGMWQAASASAHVCWFVWGISSLAVVSAGSFAA